MPKRLPPDAAQRPMFDPFEMVRLDPAPAPSPGGPKPDPKQLTLDHERRQRTRRGPPRQTWHTDQRRTDRRRD